MTSDLRVLIQCAGTAERWGGYLGVPKHFAPINGEGILPRAVRLIQAIRPEADIRIVTREHDPRYDLPGAQQEQAVAWDPQYRDANKFLDSRHLWNTEGRTILLYGDAYFTTAAMEKILRMRPLLDGWAVYARLSGSKITGTKWAEQFAHVFDPAVHAAWEASLLALPVLTKDWMGGRCGGHEQYLNMEFGDPCQWPKLGPHAVHINDWTDDFDYPKDWDQWCLRYALASAKLKATAQ